MHEQLSSRDTATEMPPSSLENDLEVQEIRSRFEGSQESMPESSQPHDEYEATRSDRVDEAKNNVYKLFDDQSEVSGPDIEETAAYQPRALGSERGDWDFVRGQRETGSDVSIGDDLSVSITNAKGEMTNYRTLDDARAAFESTHEQILEDHETDTQEEVLVEEVEQKSDVSSTVEESEVLDAVKASIAEHTERCQQSVEQEEAPDQEEETKTDKELARQAVDALDKRVTDALGMTEKLDKRLDAVLGRAYDTLRAEAAKLDRTSGSRLDIVSPYVTKTMESVESMLRDAQSTNRQKEAAVSDVRGTADKMSSDQRLASDLQTFAKESVRELKGIGTTNDDLRSLTNILGGINTRPSASREDVVFGMKRLMRKIDEARQSNANDPRQSKKLHSLRDKLNATLGDQ